MIIVFNKVTGQILKNVFAADTDLLTYQTETEGALLSTEFVDDEMFYINGNVPHAMPAKPSQFHDFDFVTKTWLPRLPQAKAQKLAQLLKEYRRRKELPLDYDSKVLDAGEDAREQLTFKAFEFAERVRLNQPAGAAARIWENADGTFHAFATDTGFRNWLGGFVIALSERTAQLRIAARQHAQNIRALTTVEGVLGYDITTGWPG